MYLLAGGYKNCFVRCGRRNNINSLSSKNITKCFVVPRRIQEKITHKENNAHEQKATCTKMTLQYFFRSVLCFLCLLNTSKINGHKKKFKKEQQQQHRFIYI